MEISDEERKRLEERRATQEKVSSMMGDYLLKGYRMLDSYCPTCGNIQMRAKEGEKPVCIQCTLSQGKTSKKEATPTTHATPISGPTTLPGAFRVPSPNSIGQSDLIPSAKSDNSVISSLPHAGGHESTTEEEESPDASDDDDDENTENTNMRSAIVSARRALSRKLIWASKEMEHTTSAEYSTQLASLIQSISIAVHQLKDL